LTPHGAIAEITDWMSMILPYRRSLMLGDTG
jgi:hypothetical protein